MQVAFSKLRV
uniref:Uncharacterized protein n=1 Tax=Arundo donax TaxID=35708 RepID=A0A0A8ZBL2_ARUDO